MKRTPLHRKTRLRPMSAKKRKQIAKLSPLRRAYRESFTVCMPGNPSDAKKLAEKLIDHFDKTDQWSKP